MKTAEAVNVYRHRDRIIFCSIVTSDRGRQLNGAIRSTKSDAGPDELGRMLSKAFEATRVPPFPNPRSAKLDATVVPILAASGTRSFPEFAKEAHLAIVQREVESGDILFTPMENKSDEYRRFRPLIDARLLCKGGTPEAIGSLLLQALDRAM